MQEQKKCARLLAIILSASILMGGCIVQQDTKKVEDLEFTVVGEAEIPEALMDQIELKKEEAFSMTYSDNEYLYIAKGCGIQETGGYSIAVQECYLSDNTICFKTDLIAPGEEDEVQITPSYPYIVIKLELREESVVFL